MKAVAIVALFALFAVTMAATPAQTEEKQDLQASPSLLYGGIGLGYPYGLGIGKLGLGYGGIGLGYPYGLGIGRLGLLGGYGLYGGGIIG